MVLEDQATLATDTDPQAQNMTTGQNGARDGAPPPSLCIEKASSNDGPNEEANQSKSNHWETELDTGNELWDTRHKSAQVSLKLLVKRMRWRKLFNF